MKERASVHPCVARCCRTASLLFFLISTFSVHAQKFIGTRLEYLPEGYNLELLEVETVATSDQWVAFDQLVPNLGMGEGVEWMRLTLDPMTENGKLIEIQNAGIDDLTCFMVCDGKIIASYPGGVMNAPSEGHQFGTYPSFPVPLVECNKLHALFRMHSNKPMIIPLRISGPRKVLEDAHQRDVLFALYAGVMLVMLLYNLFLFLSIGDRSYLEYVLFIFAIGGTQLVLNGYAPIFGIDGWPWLNLRLTHLFGVFSGITTIVFVQNFLRLSRYVPWLNKLLNGYFILYLLALGLALIGRLEWSYQLINFCAAAIFFFIPGTIITMRKGYSPAKYFLLAFTVFILGSGGFCIERYRCDSVQCLDVLRASNGKCHRGGRAEFGPCESHQPIEARNRQCPRRAIARFPVERANGPRTEYGLGRTGGQADRSVGKCQ